MQKDVALLASTSVGVVTAANLQMLDVAMKAIAKGVLEVDGWRCRGGFWWRDFHFSRYSQIAAG
jgi:hypothetical protein